MCGIVAQYGRPDAAELEQMLERITHRGPDDTGAVTIGDAWLGHRRLSIVDLDNGRQPLGPGGCGLHLVGNGEIYNHADVRREHLSEAPFATRSDNEVALHLLSEGDPESLGHLEGMFAVCAAAEDGRFLAARDPVGIKPLYWTPPAPGDEGPVRFASEMRAFDERWLPRVESFPPGCAWTPEHGLQRFAAPVAAELREGVMAEIAHRDEVIAAIADVLEGSVRRQMMGDVRVGVFLSGGLDSSIVAALAAKVAAEQGERLVTFAVGTPDSPDLEAAREVARYLDTEHVETIYDADEALDALPEVVRTIESFDPGLVRSAVPNYFLARETAQHVKVVLTGEGADELFAGYEYVRGLDADALHRELVRTIEGLHDLNLQRCDRVTMAHGLEARVPFLDREVIDFAMRIPAALKRPAPGRPEKALLREAFDGRLPDSVLWRDKAEFGDGSGARDVLQEEIDARISDAEFETARHEVTPSLRSKQELYYWRVLRDHLPGVRPELTIGRFAVA